MGRVDVFLERYVLHVVPRQVQIQDREPEPTEEYAVRSGTVPKIIKNISIKPEPVSVSEGKGLAFLNILCNVAFASM